MKIYTKTGDKGDTSLNGGMRVAKSSIRIDACGTIDELNSQLGIARAHGSFPEIDKVLAGVQEQLLNIGADIATPFESKKNVNRIRPDDITKIELTIDDIEARLPALSSFIIPGGSVLSAHLHLARAVCRRAERIVDALARKESIGSNPLPYLNRLSDLLFVLARLANTPSGRDDKGQGGSEQQLH